MTFKVTVTEKRSGDTQTYTDHNAKTPDFAAGFALGFAAASGYAMSDLDVQIEAES